MKDESPFAVGHHRPVYFWAGPDTVRMNRLKFMNQPVKQSFHLAAHTPQAAQRLAEAGFNWAYLMVNWGFPPEETAEQRAGFRQAVQDIHAAGIRVFGYVQLSNCVYAGSHRERDWYALDPQGQHLDPGDLPGPRAGIRGAPRGGRLAGGGPRVPGT